jgi:hypothetical protein
MSVTSILHTGYTPILAGLIEKCLNVRVEKRVDVSMRRTTVLPVVALGSLETVDQGRYPNAELDRPIGARRHDCRRGE